MKYDRFSTKAKLYDMYRPKYSKEFIEYLYDCCRLNDKSVIADIGAGTGILSEEFLLKKTSVICVEPNEEMLMQAKNRLSKYGHVSFIKSSAENTTIADDSVNLVTVGQAFHWFDKKKFLKECKRILLKDGYVALAWNISNSSDPISNELFELNSKYIEIYKGYNSRDKEDNNKYYDFFLNGKFDCSYFDNDLLININEFIGRCLSRSYAPNPDDVNYYEYIDGLKHIFEKYSKNDKIKIMNTTKSIIGRVK